MTTIMPAIPTRKDISHDRIVEVAARTLRRAGYRGVGVADVMKSAGLTHGGFYAHFESREALLVEAMQRAGRDNEASMAEAVERRVRKGTSRLVALVSSYLHEKHMERAEDGCVVAALSSEMTRQDDVVREQARRLVAELVGRVRAALPRGTDPAEAEVVAATMVGALQLARTLGGKPGRDLLASTRRALIERHDRVTGT